MAIFILKAGKIITMPLSLGQLSVAGAGFSLVVFPGGFPLTSTDQHFQACSLEQWLTPEVQM